MHALFHIKTVIISRDRYRPEGFRPRIDIGRGMITVLIWKKACINLFITYFNIELKRTKLTSHTDTKLMDMSDRYRLRVLLPKHQQIFPRWMSTFSKQQMTVGRKWPHGAHERLDIVLSEFCPDGMYCCGTSGVDVWATLTLLLTNMWLFPIIARSQSWLFAFRENISVYNQVFVFALKYPYLHPNSTSGICAVVSTIICQSTRKDCI